MFFFVVLLALFYEYDIFFKDLLNIFFCQQEIINPTETHLRLPKVSKKKRSASKETLPFDAKNAFCLMSPTALGALLSDLIETQRLLLGTSAWLKMKWCHCFEPYILSDE